MLRWSAERDAVPAVAGLRVMDAFVTEVASSDSLNCAVTRAFTATPAAPLTGLMEVTDGGVVSAADPEMKYWLTFCPVGAPFSPLNETSCHRYWVRFSSGDSGVNETFRRSAEKAIVPGYLTLVSLPLYKMKFALETEVGSTGLLKVTRRTVLVPTPTALAGGFVAEITGPTASLTVPVVKLKLPGLVRLLPAESVSCAV